MDKIYFKIGCAIAFFIFCRPLDAMAGGTFHPGDTTKPKVTVKPNLLYVTLDKSETWLIPYIERKLKNVRRPDTDVTLFGSVVSLNILASHQSIQATVMDDLNEVYNGAGTAQAQTLKETTKVTYAQWLRNYQSLLTIKVASLGELVEYQFTLYNIVSAGRDIRYVNSSSIFLDPRSSHYQADVNRGLDQVFADAGKPPAINLISNIRPVGDTFYFTSEDTLNLQPIIDDESAEGDRIYFWIQDTTQKLPILPSKKDQLLHNLLPGRYTLLFRMSNGFNYSSTQIINLNVYTRPRLTVTRPTDVSFFQKFGDRLVIQEYLFAPPRVDYFSDYLVLTDTTRFAGVTPNLLVRLTDKNATRYAARSFGFRANSTDTLGFVGASLIGSLDTMQTPIKTGRNNSYYITLMARNPAMQSGTIRNELSVYRRRPLSLVYDVMIFPVDKAGLFHSWINASVGLDLRLNRWLSGIAIFGTDLAQASFKHFYTDLIANFGPIREWSAPFNRIEGGPALLINHDNGEESTGVKLAYNFYGGGHTNLKIGIGFYNQDHVNYYAIHFTGDIFFNH